MTGQKIKAGIAADYANNNDELDTSLGTLSKTLKKRNDIKIKIVTFN